MVTEREETAGRAHMLECTNADDKVVHLKFIVLLTNATSVNLIFFIKEETPHQNQSKERKEKKKNSFLLSRWLSRSAGNPGQSRTMNLTSPSTVARLHVRIVRIIK